MTHHSISRHLVLLLAMVAACASWAQTINIGGQKAVHDSLNDLWLCSVPQELFGTDWTAAVVPDSTWESFTVDGVTVTSDDEVTFTAIAGGKLYPFTAMSGDKPITGNITFTWLPVLELSGEFSNEYAEGTMSLNAPDSNSSKSGMLAKIKWRGGITNTANKHKHNYSIKFIDENGEKKNRRMLDMRKDNHWKLDAGQIDALRLRNRVCSDLWLDMARDPWHKSMDSTVVNGSNGRITEVLLNGEYLGIYSLVEPLDRKQLALVKHDTVNNVFHGQQWASKYSYPTYFLPEYSNYNNTWNGNEVNYPDFDEVFPTDWSTLYNSFEFARRVDAVDNWQALGDSLGYYFDVPVMEDYFIFIVTLQALDNEVKNIYYSCYDKTLEAPRLVMTPWDLDISLGAQSIPGLDVSPERPMNWIMHVGMGDMFNHSPVHRKEIINRYWQLRRTWLNTDSLVARFQQAVDELEMSGASAREEARWSRDSDLGGNVLDISAEMEYVADWIVRRMAYLDENVFVRQIVVGDVDDDGAFNITDITKLIAYVLAGGGDINTDNGDIDGDGLINISDVTALISKLLTGE